MAEASGEPLPHEGKLRALAITPTRELALQVRACERVCVLNRLLT